MPWSDPRLHVFGQFLRQLRRELLAARAVAQGDGHGAFRVFLADHVLVEFDNNLTRGEFVECECPSSALLGKRQP